MNQDNIVYIDNIPVEYEGEKNLLEMVRKSGIDLPTFCYHSELSTYGACRQCVVDIDGRGVQASCTVTPQPGMRIKTQTNELREMRKVNLELLLANHDISCPTCVRVNDCKLKDMSARLGISTSRFKRTEPCKEIDVSSPSLVRDPNKCVLCGDCVRMCKEVQGIGAIDFTGRGANSTVEPAFAKGLNDVECVNCGQCVVVCPTGALAPKPEIEKAWHALNDPEVTVVAQIAPAVRVAIGELFGMEPGEIAIGQIVASMKRLGFDQVYDTSFSADLTVIEETTEFLARKLNNDRLPQFTSCCPAWVKYAEQYYPDLLPHLSSCKSPQQMFGSLAKEMLPEVLNVKKEKLFVVSIMPCTAKKYEAEREEFVTENARDVDAVLTSRELGLMIQEAGLNFKNLQPESLDLPMGFKTGAGLIFGATGGVSEAVLRYAYEKVTGRKPDSFEMKYTRGKEGIRKAKVTLGEIEISLGVVHSLANAQTVCNQVREGHSDLDIIEVMACPGGCVNGAGQPTPKEADTREKRTKGLYTGDKMLQLHLAQENPYIQEVYEKLLGEPGGPQAHKLLHTHYRNRKRILQHDLDMTSLMGDKAPKIQIKVCIGTNCHLAGAQPMIKQLMDYIEEQKLSHSVDLQNLHQDVDVKATFCMEKCQSAINVTVGQTVIENAKLKDVIAEMHVQLANMPVA